MAGNLPFEIANFNLVNFADVYPDLIDSNPKEISVQLKDSEGNILTKTIWNRGMFLNKVLEDINIAMNKIYYVDAVNGDDGNDGSVDHPFKTIKKACDATPVGGFGDIVVLSDIVLDTPIKLIHKTIQITTYHKITVESYEVNEYSAMNFFDLKYNSNIIINLFGNNDDHTPAIEYKKTTNPDFYNGTGFIRAGHTNYLGSVAINFRVSKGSDYALVSLLENTNLLENVPGQNDRIGTVAISITGYYEGKFILPDNSYICHVSENGVIDFSLYRYGWGFYDDNGNTKSDNAIISGIVRDADSGNPINVISNINFSS